MAEPKPKPAKVSVVFNIDPQKTPVYYTDNLFVSSNNYGVIIDFGQNVGTSGQQHVVTRVGMSFEHAKRMVQVLHEHLETNER